MPTSPDWFKIDRDGFREIYGSFPVERLVSELVQNALDEKSTKCVVSMQQAARAGRPVTVVSVEDDNANGFSDLTHAYTLFATSSKRSNPTARGRFNLGEKICFARAISAKVETTTGSIIFDSKGRRSSKVSRPAGSMITALFPRWKDREMATAVSFLKRINPPANVTLTINGEAVPTRPAEYSVSSILPTEFLKLQDGVPYMSNTSRKTTVAFSRKAGETAFLYELGIPVTAIDGGWDADVGQKVPMSFDRSTVGLAYLREIYADLLNALQGTDAVSELGTAIVKMAMESKRITPATARDVFEKIYGKNAVIQSQFCPDANQEAARADFTVVPGRTFGPEVNDKLRDGGVQTSKEVFGRHNGSSPDIHDVPIEDKHRRFLAYARMLASELFANDPDFRPADFHLRLAVIDRRVAGVNSGGTSVTFNVNCVTDFSRPVSRCTSLIVHELSHARGAGHDGVYDRQYEAFFDQTIALLSANPEKFREFEPELFALPSRQPA